MLAYKSATLTGQRYDNRRISVRLVSAFLMASFGGAFSVSAQPISVSDSEQFASELMFNCPTDATIRVAGASSVSRFQSLKGCADQIEIAPVENLNRPVAPVQIETEYADEDPFNRTPPDEQAGPSTILAKGGKTAGSKSKKQNLADGAKYTPAVLVTSSKGRPLGENDARRMVRIAPDVQEVSGWEEAATLAPPSSIAGAADAAQSGEGTILTLRPRSYSTKYDPLIAQVAVRHAIDPLLLHAVIKQESGYRPRIRSHAGAIGLMQIMPGTGRMLGVRKAHLTDPASNVDAGARLLRQLHGRFNGNFDLVLAAYNAGEGAVRKYGNRIPPYRETQNYVRSVKAHYVRLLRENGYSGVQF